MGFEEARRESHERWKIRRTYFWVEFLGVIILTTILFYVYIQIFGDKKDLKEFSFWGLFIKTPADSPLYFILTFFIFLLFLFYWKGNIVNKILKKIGLFPYIDKYIYSPISTAFEIILPSSMHKWLHNIFFDTRSRFDELDEFFYPAPKKDDFLPKVPYGKFKAFKGKYDPYTLFDFDVANLDKKDENGTDRIINFFRGKDFNERSNSYIDLFGVIEGKIKGWGSDVVFKEINSPLKIDIDKNTGKIKSIKVDFKNDVYDPLTDTIYFSPEMIKETLELTSYLFYKYVKVSLEKGTKIRRRYGDVLKDPKKFEKLMDLFKFMFFRRLLLNYGSIPSGWVVIRAEDYDLRRIVSSIDREVVIAIRDSNMGIGKSVDDRFASMFLFIWHAFFTKSFASQPMSDVLWCFDPLKSLTDVKLKKQIDLSNKKVEKEALEDA